MKKGLYALASGTFALGVAEYIMMGILPEVATGLDISITGAGHLISAYALGVCAGAPFLAILSRNLPLRKILILLMCIFILGNLLTTISPGYFTALCARFITGLPHGAYFGVGVIVANRLAKKGKGTTAVATMVMGMSVANLIGVPLCNLLGHYVSWRLIFVFAALWGLLTVWLIRQWVPALPALPRTNIRGMFAFLKHSGPWLLIAATVLANSGIFCWYSYINPFMTGVTGIPVSAIPLLMLLSGGSMCIGNYLGGKLSDKYSPGLTAMYTQGIILLPFP